jgi:pyrimidine-nucleoside phosphorylase
MDIDEVAVLTDAMMNSGDVVDTSPITKPKVDKHSTGGIGDKVSLVLAPLIASCGLAVPMISGRGLGITGGTLDKLESIPGYRTDLSDDEFIKVVQTCGCSITGQTGQLAPADKKLYALRDVTGTVPSIPLITASIMSKKLAAGIDALVLDVKWGHGAFMKTQEDAAELAQSMVRVGTRMGKGMAALITDMNQPLGKTAGNTVEIVETVQTLRDEGPDDLLEVTMTLAARMLLLAGKTEDKVEALAMLNDQITSGKAFDVFKQMVELHGGDPAAIDDLSKLPTASIEKTYEAPTAGYISAVDAESVGKACLVLGAGRQKTDDQVDHAVGASNLAKIGDKIEKGQTLAVLHANDEGKLAEAMALLDKAFTISEESVPPRALITDTIVGKG